MMETDERPVPYAPEAEISVLGSCWLSPDAIAEARAMLSPEDFFRNAHRSIFAAVCDLYDEGEAIDPITLSQRLKDRGDLEEAGGHRYIAEIMDAVPSAANVEHYAKIVREKATLRRIILACRETITDALSANGGGPKGVIEEAERRIFNATHATTSGGFKPAKEALWEAMRVIEEESKREGGVTGLATGIPKLDRMTAGFQPGDMTVLAARPSMGKTALGLSISNHVASAGKVAAIESLEMTAGQLVKRSLAMRAGIDLMAIRRQEMTQDDYEKLARAAAWFNELPVEIDDDLSGTVPELRAKVRRLASRDPVGLIMVDYLQLMSGEGRSRVQEIGSITRGLKRIAREFDTHVLALSQLSRACESRTPPRPILSDLRDSGDIEQDADNVLLLWRPEYYFDDRTGHEAWAKWQGKGELIIAKQRNGGTGRIMLRWDAKSTKFTELARERDEAQFATA